MTSLNILIVGGGIAGPMAAYWLAKAGHRVTIIERAPTLLKTGQGIDIEGPAREIIDRMGVLDQMKAKSTQEEGFAFTDNNGVPVATIRGGLTQEIEIMRGEMCEILCKAADAFESVHFRYETNIVDIVQMPDRVEVLLSNDQKESYDAVIGADGMRSKTRELAFDEGTKAKAFRARDHYCAYFSIPHEDGDGPHSRWQNATRGRSILIRPHTDEISSVYLAQRDKSDSLSAACRSDKESQKLAVAAAFEGVGGLGPRVVKGMLESDNFYFDSLSQIILDKWSQERVALIGDAAYAPSAVTGQGVILSVLGAYIIAGELSETPENPIAAFKRYESRIRKYVDKQQAIPFGGNAPRVANPRTNWGIWILRMTFRFIAWSGIWKWISFKGPSFPLPEYPRMNYRD
ncbi:Putative FAD-binding domain, FAD/NAD(P)-binding domain superfamily [Septoria linicola]|uniref:FAD-binding domain, FAD/NAD(P)-binding domain superfamily n=1 Tax=Septoria linicola TaxID=215465 RepID=A0A9Q9B8L3_9PEZI|nr:putative FAD-binding domain, FAD/NAD(P)-binding domain superfamily [Septoria linicola]USW59061.1 Putative FAD-binding domain, FAD/NAD(P)-binding domain superfamily [Septoria linicola]